MIIRITLSKRQVDELIGGKGMRLYLHLGSAAEVKGVRSNFTYAQAVCSGSSGSSPIRSESMVMENNLYALIPIVVISGEDVPTTGSTGAA